jgi:hypothetical protein
MGEQFRHAVLSNSTAHVSAYAAEDVFLQTVDAAYIPSSLPI